MMMFLRTPSAEEAPKAKPIRIDDVWEAYYLANGFDNLAAAPSRDLSFFPPDIRNGDIRLFKSVPLC